MTEYRIRFCPECGSASSPVEPGGPSVCQQCGRHWFVAPKCGVEAVLVRPDGAVVWCVRSIAPGVGKLDIPGGFVDANESAEHALLRELREELGVQESQLANLRYVGSAVNQYDFEGLIHPVLVLQYTASLDGPVSANEECSSVEFRSANEVEATDLAWPRLHLPLLEQLGLRSGAPK